MIWLTKAKAAMSGQAAVAREEKQEQLVLEKLAEVQVKFQKQRKELVPLKLLCRMKNYKYRPNLLSALSYYLSWNWC
jgi:hypothetical protein